MDLGNRIREIRKKKKVTLVELSQITGVAQASLSRIETGIMKGTVDSHRKIAEALGLSLSELYTGIDEKLNEISHRSAAESKQEATLKSNNVRLELLVPQPNMRKFSPVLATLPAGQSLTYNKTERNTDKFIWAQRGSVVIALNNKEYTLEEHDSLYFDASFSHIIKNKTTSEACVLIVTSPAIV